MSTELIESTANMLRGMCMDPRIPLDTREAMWSRVARLDKAASDAAPGDAVEVLCYWSDGRCERMELDAWPQRGDLPADAVRFDIAWPDMKTPNVRGNAHLTAAQEMEDGRE